MTTLTAIGIGLLTTVLILVLKLAANPPPPKCNDSCFEKDTHTGETDPALDLAIQQQALEIEMALAKQKGNL